MPNIKRNLLEDRAKALITNLRTLLRNDAEVLNTIHSFATSSIDANDFEVLELAVDILSQGH